MKQETRQRFFSSSDQCWATPIWLFDRFNPLEEPKLKVAHYKSGTFGSANYKKNQIMINSTCDHYDKTIKHEILHLVNYKHFNPKKKRLGHNKQFWLLCYEFGLTFEDRREKPMEKLNPAFFPSALVVFGDVSALEIGKLKDIGTWLKEVT